MMTLDLHQNSLSGPLPSTLSNLPRLRTLNMASNFLTGT